MSRKQISQWWIKSWYESVVPQENDTCLIVYVISIPTMASCLIIHPIRYRILNPTLSRLYISSFHPSHSQTGRTKMIGKIKNSISKKQQQEPEEESENEAANTTGSTWSLMASASAMSANSVPPNPGPTMAYDGSARPKIPPPEAESEEPTASTATGTSTGTSNATKKSTKEKAPATHLEADDLSTSLAKVKLKKQPIDKKTLDTVKKDENDAKREGKEPKKTRQLKMLERKQKFRPPLTDKEKAARQIWNDENHAAKLEARDYYNKVRVDALMDEITWEDGEYIMEEVTTLPEWPPALTKTQLDKLKERAITYAISTGFVIIPPAAENRSIVTHAPLSLLPTPFPRTLFQTAKTLQTILNSLYMRIAVDHAFLSKVFEGSVNHVDPWQNWLYYYYRHCRKFPNAVSLPPSPMVFDVVLTHGSSYERLAFSDQIICCISPHQVNLCSSSKSNSTRSPRLSEVCRQRQSTCTGMSLLPTRGIVTDE